MLSVMALGAVVGWAGPAKAPPVGSINTQIVNLWPDGSPNNPEDGPRPAMEMFLPFVDGQDATIVILPGGGYGSLSPYERLFAEYFRGLGYRAAVVRYRVAPHRYPAPYADAARAIRLLRQGRSPEFAAARKLILMGGSAGGHLAALVATRPELYRDPGDDLAMKVSARPDRLVLAYPVISAVENFASPLSFSRLLGDNPPGDLCEAVSPERHVTAENPPVFLFHAADDRQASVENSLLFARACWRAGVPAELHVFPRGGHGRLFAYGPDVSGRWRELLQQWLAQELR
ncbi:alpha/beta hydrolase [Opitutus sp. ER46]|uniref:alpha/beta hydrolase n=1 Tax=Opitutus sp. ER46 TaxID=2161864 RepID=UPI001304F79D|nr:alpha/beta hydrolase [Opitutus sp. ER46]